MDLDKCECIDEIERGELSFTQCLDMFKRKIIWDFESQNEFDISNDISGCIAIHILRKILIFFTDGEEEDDEITIKTDIQNVLKNIDVTLSKVLIELAVDRGNGHDIEYDDTEKLLNDNQKFKMFRRSKTYCLLFKKIYRIFCCVKSKLIYKPVRRVDFLDHVRDLVFYSKVFSYFFCCNVFNNKKNEYVYINITDFDESTIKSIDIVKFYESCMASSNLHLGIQKYIVKYALDDVAIFLKRYDDRFNLITNSVNNVENRYVHQLWDKFEKLYNKVYISDEFKKSRNGIYKCISNIQSDEFKLFITELIKGLIFRRDPLTRFHVLFFDKLVNVYMRDILDIGNFWEKHIKCMSIDEMKDNIENHPTSYPIVVRICQTIYGVFHKCCIYFGDIIQVYLKFKQIIVREFNSKIVVWDENQKSTKVIKIAPFLVF